MVSETQNNMDNPQKEIEQQLKHKLGPFPRDPQKPEEKPAERLLVIDDNNVPGAGSVINPTALEGQESSTEDTPSKSAGSKGHKLKRFFKAWWQNKRARLITFGTLLVIIFGLALYPSTRYFILNNAGVRSSASVKILDNSTQQPLKDVQVTLANATGLTDTNGNVKLQHIKLGKTKLVITKRAFATLTQPVTIGWGSNPLGNFGIKAVGTQYTFTVTDWLSTKPIDKAQASSGDADAVSDSKGKIVLTIDPSEINSSLTATISADGYRDETVILGADTTPHAIQMVTSRKEVFVSNRSGRYDVYSVDIDGKNEKLVLAGTGLERDDIVLVPHPTDEEAALVSSRVNVRDADGFLLSSLTLLNLKDNSTFTVAQADRIQIIGWVGQRLVFVQIAAGASAANSSRFRLMSYDYKTADKKELARSNAFNDVALIGGNVYYAPSDDAPGLFRIAADGSNKKTLLDKEVWNIFRPSYDTLDLAVGVDWYQYKLGDSNAIKLNQAPANPKNRLYISNPDNTHSLWVDQRDGKGVLLNYLQSTNQDKILQTQSGLSYPVRWLTDSAFIYRIHTETETADYAMSLEGGTAHKIKDVFNAPGIDRWYYY